MFLAIVGAGVHADPIAATALTLLSLTDLVTECEPCFPLRFTAASANGNDLYAFRYAVNDHANSLYYRSATSKPLNSNIACQEM